MECMAVGSKAEVCGLCRTVLGTKPPGVQFTEKGMVTVFQHRGQPFTATDENSKTQQSCFLKKALVSLMIDSVWVGLVMSLSKLKTWA